MSGHIKKFWLWIRFSKWSAPLIFLITLLFSFGIYLPYTGFYWDDWPMLYIIHTHNNLWSYLLPDRPFFSWFLVLISPIINASPLISKLIYIALRWIIVVCLWRFLNILWPKADRQNLCVALLFAIYPAFIQNETTLTFGTIFIALLLYIVSLIFMLLAIKYKNWRLLFLLLSVIIGALGLCTIEYFWGLELLRPVFIWMFISDQTISLGQRFKQCLLKWLPYLAVLLAIIIWRLFILDYQKVNSPTLLGGLVNSPLSASIKFLQTIIQDTLDMLLGSWARAVSKQTIDFNSAISLVSWGMMLGLTAFVGGYLYMAYRENKNNIKESSKQAMQAMLTGAIAILVGMFPIWATGKQESVGMFSDRLAIPAILGLSLLVVGIVFLLIPKWSHRVIIVALLVGLAVGLHIRAGNKYRLDWNNQKAFYWQLYWRAPAIKPDTAIISEASLFEFATKYSISAALNVLYPVADGTTKIPLWSFELDDLLNDPMTTETQLLSGAELTSTLRTLSFATSSLNSILISVRPDNTLYLHHCLWLITSRDIDNPHLSAATIELSALSNTDRIFSESTSSTTPDPGIFGSEPAHTWCYFYEKADLARQFDEWKKITDLGDLATEEGYKPSVFYEYLPFIEGYIHERKWDVAGSLSQATIDNDPLYQPAVCAAWNRSFEDMTLVAEENETAMNIFTSFGCPK